MEFDGFDPFFDQLAPMNLVASEADPSELAKGAPVSLRDPANKLLEIAIPSYDDRCQPIADCRYYRIRRAGRKYVPNKADIMAASLEKVCDRLRHILVDQQQHGAG
jgi:hypothetical protein